MIQRPQTRTATLRKNQMAPFTVLPIIMLIALGISGEMLDTQSTDTSNTLHGAPPADHSFSIDEPLNSHGNIPVRFGLRHNPVANEGILWSAINARMPESALGKGSFSSIASVAEEQLSNSGKDEDDAKVKPVKILDELKNVVKNVPEDVPMSNVKMEFYPTEMVENLKIQTADLVQDIFNDNPRAAFIELAKVLDELDRLTSLPQEMLDYHPATKSEILKTLDILEDISNAVSKAAATDFKPVKTMADIANLGMNVKVTKRSFYCPYLYRKAFSIHSCWRYVMFLKRRPEQIRRLTEARQMVLQNKMSLQDVNQMLRIANM